MKQEQREQMTKDLLVLLNMFSKEIDKKNHDLVNEFIEHHEFGVALEWLYATLINSKVSISQSQNEMFQKLAKEMQIVLAGEQ